MQYPHDPSRSCHYIITDGVIHWAGGSWHGRTGQQLMVVLTDSMLDNWDDQ
jgi:hypothetical protein